MTYTTQNTFEISSDIYGGGGTGGGGGFEIAGTATVSEPTNFISIPVPATAKFLVFTGRNVQSTGAFYGIYIQDGVTGFGANVPVPAGGTAAAITMQAWSPDSDNFVGQFSVGMTNGDPAVTDMISGGLLAPLVDVQFGIVGGGDLTAGTFVLYYA